MELVGTSVSDPRGPGILAGNVLLLALVGLLDQDLASGGDLERQRSRLPFMTGIRHTTRIQATTTPVSLIEIA